jgi:hypothetical protein
MSQNLSQNLQKNFNLIFVILMKSSFVLDLAYHIPFDTRFTYLLMISATKKIRCSVCLNFQVIYDIFKVSRKKSVLHAGDRPKVTNSQENIGC